MTLPNLFIVLLSNAPALFISTPYIQAISVMKPVASAALPSCPNSHCLVRHYHVYRLLSDHLALVMLFISHAEADRTVPVSALIFCL